MEPIERTEHRGLIVELHHDPDGLDPRTDYDNMGTMVCAHHRHTLGDEQGTGSLHEALAEAIDRGATVILPLYLYDHSMLSMSAGDPITLAPGGHDFREGGECWNCGAYEGDGANDCLPDDRDIVRVDLTPADLDGERARTFPFDADGWDSGIVGILFDTDDGRTRIGVNPADVHSVLLAEVNVYDAYLRGNVYGYIVEDATGQTLDSCWGFIGDLDYMRSEAMDAANYHADRIAEAREAIDPSMVADLRTALDRIERWNVNSVTCAVPSLPRAIEALTEAIEAATPVEVSA